jgi:hypothetical protein
MQGPHTKKIFWKALNPRIVAGSPLGTLRRNVSQLLTSIELGPRGSPLAQRLERRKDSFDDLETGQSTLEIEDHYFGCYSVTGCVRTDA